MQLVLKRVEAKIYSLLIAFKNILGRKAETTPYFTLHNLKIKYSEKKKIVVLASGPSANEVELDEDTLYIVTNSGYRLVKDFDYLYFINDGFYVKKVLAIGNYFLKDTQEIIFFYQNSELHKKGFCFLKKHLTKISKKNKYMISELDSQSASLENWNHFSGFYKQRNLPIKIQNSGVFLLLLGYFLAIEMKLPIEVYGLDLGVGGVKHFDNKGVAGKSVTNDRVRSNVKMYLDFMIQEHTEFVNFSYFKG